VAKASTVADDAAITATRHVVEKPIEAECTAIGHSPESHISMASR
jgi:hypothetical protein